MNNPKIGRYERTASKTDRALREEMKLLGLDVEEKKRDIEDEKMPEAKYEDPEGMDRPTTAMMSKTTSRLVPSITISENNAEVFAVQFSPDGRFLAAGCGDGAIRVFNTGTGRLAYNLQTGSQQALPVTCLRFRPISSEAKTRNVLVSTDAGGNIQHWHMTSGKCLNTITEEDQQFYSIHYRSDGLQFAAVGKDTSVRIYDEQTKQETLNLQGGMGYGNNAHVGHSNRIFSVRYGPHDPYTVVSGGWDNNVLFWDLRSGEVTRSLFGPHLSGDSLDIFDDVVLTGSWRPQNILETWDFNTCEKIEEIPWHRTTHVRHQPCMLYTAAFSPNGKFIAAGGSGANEAKVFDRTCDNGLVGTITGLSRGVFTLDFAPTSSKLAVAGGDASIRIIDIIGGDSNGEKL
mmetsp:Transcript_25713/g.33230  ORF Transcript_25713/g.33230 Transcript_25713/m.33230 type:complete len:402 (+) Transcript_25713:112-1317(+)